MSKTETVNFLLRMPEELGSTIYKLADEEKRAVNTVLVLLLEKALKEKYRKSKKKGADVEVK